MPVIRSQTALHRFLRRIRIQEFNASAILLHYDSQSSDIKPWRWYDIIVIALSSLMFTF
jgi:hypothetical protein